MDGTEFLLTLTLSVAVPLWIEQHRATPFVERTRRARFCSEQIAAHGDVLLYRSKREGATADVFDRTAEGLALAAFQPGGVDFHGMHWEA